MSTGKQFNQYAMQRSLISMCCAAALLGACSKSAPPAEQASSPASAPAEAQAGAAPTGLVKNPVRHSQVADVTQWMDQASTKTAAQLAQEEKLAREKLAQEAARKAQEQKQLSAKPASTVKETVLAQPAPAPVQQKAPEPQVVVAKAPEPAPAPAPVKAAEPEKIVFKLVNGTQPKFPNSALRAGYSEGNVSARLHVDPDGKVAQVEILKAKPAKYFDKEVVAAVSQWKYAPIARASTTTVEFSFHLD